MITNVIYFSDFSFIVQILNKIDLSKAQKWLKIFQLFRLVTRISNVGTDATLLTTHLVHLVVPTDPLDYAYSSEKYLAYLRYPCTVPTCSLLGYCSSTVLYHFNTIATLYSHTADRTASAFWFKIKLSRVTWRDVTWRADSSRNWLALTRFCIFQMGTMTSLNASTTHSLAGSRPTTPHSTVSTAPAV